jgi:hypothetical protein
VLLLDENELGGPARMTQDEGDIAGCRTGSFRHC